MAKVNTWLLFVEIFLLSSPRKGEKRAFLFKNGLTFFWKRPDSKVYFLTD